MDSPYLKYPKLLVETDVAEISSSLSASIHSRMGGMAVKFKSAVIVSFDSHYITIKLTAGNNF